ncbi:MAG: MATE family efflux transporter [Gammaproteobacteria bacterium]|nr:MATE family efflux transporter [Gammaproteobacteria bacterium]
MADEKTLTVFKLEFRQLLTLAIPVFFAELSTAATAFVDTVMAGRAGTHDLAGVAISSSLWTGVAVFVIGLFLAINPVVAQYAGARRYHRVQRVVQQGLWLGVVVIGLILLLFSQQQRILAFFIEDSQVFAVASGYLDGLIWGVPAFVLYTVLRPYSEGLSFTRAHMVSAVAGLLVNIPANYILIFGKLGFPAMGGAGCGWATAVSMWVMLFVLLVYTFRHPVFARASIYRFRFPLHMPDMRRLLALGIPIGFTILVEASVFAFITLFLGGLDAYKIAGHQIAMNVAYLLFMLPLSVSISASIRVGFNLGSGQREAARIAGYASVALAACFALFNVTLLFGFPEFIAGLYTDDLMVMEQAAMLMFYAGLFQIADVFATPAQGILRGYHDTRVALVLNILAYWVIALPLGYTLGLTDWLGPALEARGFWISLVIGLSAAAILLITRFLFISRNR